jgi:hypothetical protein
MSKHKPNPPMTLKPKQPERIVQRQIQKQLNKRKKG